MTPVMTPGARWFQKEKEFLLSKFAFYECNSCSKPFYGGKADCERDLNLQETLKKEDMLCRACTGL